MLREVDEVRLSQVARPKSSRNKNKRLTVFG